MSEDANTDLKVGKPWKVHSTHKSFDLAVAKKVEIAEDFDQVKILRRPNSTFDIKVRSSAKSKFVVDSKQKKEKSKTRAGRRAEKMRRRVVKNQ